MYASGLLLLFGVGALVAVAIAVMMYLYGLRRPPRLTYGAALARGWAVEPSELGLEAEALQLSTGRRDGLTLAGWRIKGRVEGGAVIVVLHGYGASRYSELSLAAILADYAGAVVVFDMPGHGESGGLSNAGLGQCSLVMHVLEQVVRPADEGGRLVLLGRSMGAGLALHVGARLSAESGLDQVAKEKPVAGAGQGLDSQSKLGPTQAAAEPGLNPGSIQAGLTHAEPTHTPDPSLAANSLASASPAGPNQPHLEAVIVEGGYRHWTEPARRRLWHNRWPPEPMVSAVMVRMFLMGIRPSAFDALKPASQLRCPLLLLHGEADRTCPPRLARALAERAQDARLVLFPGGGHLTLALQDEPRYRQALAQLLHR